MTIREVFVLRLIWYVSEMPVQAANLLTSTQRAVLVLYLRGAEPREIAEALVLQPRTVRRHLTEARKRLDAANDGHMVLRALLMRVVEVDDLLGGTQGRGSDNPKGEAPTAGPAA